MLGRMEKIFNMNQRRKHSGKMNKQINGNLKTKSSYKENGSKWGQDKKSSKLMKNQMKYTNYNNEDANSEKEEYCDDNNRQSFHRNISNANKNKHPSYGQEEEEEEEQEQEEMEEEIEEDSTSNTRSSSTNISNFSLNKNLKEEDEFKDFHSDENENGFIEKNGMKNNKNRAREFSTDNFDMYSNIYSYYDVFTEDKSEKRKYKYFQNVFSNFDRKYDPNEFNYENVDIRKGITENFLNSSSKKWNNASRRRNKSSRNEKEKQDNEKEEEPEDHFINEKEFGDYYSNFRESTMKHNGKEAHPKEYADKKKTRRKKKIQVSSNDSDSDDHKYIPYPNVKRNEGIGKERIHHAVDTEMNHANEHKANANFMKEFPDWNKNARTNRDISKDFTRNEDFFGRKKSDTYENEEEAEEENNQSELSSYLKERYAKFKETQMKNKQEEEPKESSFNHFDDSFIKEPSEGNSLSDVSLDSACSFQMDFFKEGEKELHYGRDRDKKFLKNPSKKRLYRLKKIMEVLEYSIYNEEREGRKVEAKLYQYVLYTKRLRQQITELEKLNHANKNIMGNYERDIVKLKEQNEEMKITLSTFENELSNLINKFDKNFAKELIDTKSQNDTLKKEVERLKMEIERKNSELKKIEHLNTEGIEGMQTTCGENSSMNGLAKTNPIQNNGNGYTNTEEFTNHNVKESNNEKYNTESKEERNVETNLKQQETCTNGNLENYDQNNICIEEIDLVDFPYFKGKSHYIVESVVDEFINKLKIFKMGFEKNTEKYDEETKALIHGCNIANFISDHKDICNHKRILKQLQESCIVEAKILNIHLGMKRERSDCNMLELQKIVTKQLEQSEEKNKERTGLTNSVILLLVFKNMHIFNLYKIFLTALKYDNFRWIKIMKKAIFCKFFDLSLIETNVKKIKKEESKNIHLHHQDEECEWDTKNCVHQEIIRYQMKHPLFYCSNDTLRYFLTTMYLNLSNNLINPETQDNLYHYVLQKKNLDLLKILKLTGKNYNCIFHKNLENKTPLDYIENEDIKIDLISGYILDIAGKGAENYKSGKYSVAYDLYTEALERQIKLSESLKVGKSMNENIGKLYYNRARTLMHLNKWIDVIENCNNCLHYIPKYVNAFDTQIQAYEHLLEYENALVVYKNMCTKCNIKVDEKEEKLKSQINATCFQILNINKNCDVSEIKQAFSNLSKKWHPDKLGINCSADLKKRHNNHFKRLFKAKQLLLNDRERMKEKRKKETNYVCPSILEDIQVTNDINKNELKETQTNQENHQTQYNNTNGEGNGNTKTNGRDEHVTNKKQSKHNTATNEKEESEKTQDVKNTTNDQNRFFKNNTNSFDNNNNNNSSNSNMPDVNNEPVDENFYKKLKNEYEQMNTEELQNFKTILTNSISNLIKTEVNLKGEYHELCCKEKTNVIMNARLCILQEVQKTLSVRLEKERKLKVIDNILKSKSTEPLSSSKSFHLFEKEENKNNEASQNSNGSSTSPTKSEKEINELNTEKQNERIHSERNEKGIKGNSEDIKKSENGKEGEEIKGQNGKVDKQDTHAKEEVAHEQEHKDYENTKKIEKERNHNEESSKREKLEEQGKKKTHNEKKEKMDDCEKEFEKQNTEELSKEADTLERKGGEKHFQKEEQKNNNNGMNFSKHLVQSLKLISTSLKNRKNEENNGHYKPELHTSGNMSHQKFTEHTVSNSERKESNKNLFFNSIKENVFFHKGSLGINRSNENEGNIGEINIKQKNNNELLLNRKKEFPYTRTLHSNNYKNKMELPKERSSSNTSNESSVILPEKELERKEVKNDMFLKNRETSISEPILNINSLQEEGINNNKKLDLPENKNYNSITESFIRKNNIPSKNEKKGKMENLNDQQEEEEYFESVSFQNTRSRNSYTYEKKEHSFKLNEMMFTPKEEEEEEEEYVMKSDDEDRKQQEFNKKNKEGLNNSLKKEGSITKPERKRNSTNNSSSTNEKEKKKNEWNNHNSKKTFSNNNQMKTNNEGTYNNNNNNKKIRNSQSPSSASTSNNDTYRDTMSNKYLDKIYKPENEENYKDVFTNYDHFSNFIEKNEQGEHVKKGRRDINESYASDSEIMNDASKLTHSYNEIKKMNTHESTFLTKNAFLTNSIYSKREIDMEKKYIKNSYSVEEEEEEEEEEHNSTVFGNLERCNYDQYKNIKKENEDTNEESSNNRNNNNNNNLSNTDRNLDNIHQGGKNVQLKKEKFSAEKIKTNLEHFLFSEKKKIADDTKAYHLSKSYNCDSTLLRNPLEFPWDFPNEESKNSHKSFSNGLTKSVEKNSVESNNKFTIIENDNKILTKNSKIKGTKEEINSAKIQKNTLAENKNSKKSDIDKKIKGTNVQKRSLRRLISEDKPIHTEPIRKSKSKSKDKNEKK